MGLDWIGLDLQSEDESQLAVAVAVQLEQSVLSNSINHGLQMLHLHLLLRVRPDRVESRESHKWILFY